MLSLLNTLFLEIADVIVNWLNQDANNDITGDRINLANYEGVLVVVVKPAGTAGDDLTLDFDQHDAASGGNTKAVNVRHIYRKVGTLASIAQWTYQLLATPTDTIDMVSVEGTDYAADSSAAIVAFDIKASELDANNGYKYLSMNSAGAAIGNALVTTSFYIPYGCKYGQKVPLDCLS